VVPGRRQVPPGTRLVRAVHGTLGPVTGLEATEATELETLALVSFFAAANRKVEARITDTVASNGPYNFPRPYERAIWPAGGLCVPGVIPAEASFARYGGDNFDAPPALTDDGSYCVAARPVAAGGAPGADVQARILTLPETFARDHTYQPPVETSPIIYQVVLDLEIPVADRCAAARTRVEEVLARVFGRRGAPVHALPTVDLAASTGSCHQVDSRAFNGTAMAAAVKDLVARLPEKHQRFHLVYMNNLPGPLPSTLVASVQQMVTGLRTPTIDLAPITWDVGPAVRAGFSWSMHIDLLSPHDDRFETVIEEIAKETLPLDSELHDTTKPIPLLGAGEAEQLAGASIKICRAAPEISPFAGTTAVAIARPWKVTAETPPGYRVSLPAVITVPRKALKRNSVSVRFEICTRYCDGHPFRTEMGEDQQSWSANRVCAEGGKS
jgi:hypothetical protein